MGRVTTRVPSTQVTRVPEGSRRLTRPDTVAVEEPLEIRVDGIPVTTTMRTPGDDMDLTLGHLLTEGLIDEPATVSRMMHCTDVDPSGSPTFNVVEVTLAPGRSLLRRPSRSETMTSACGVCGTQTIEAIRRTSRYTVAHDPLVLSPEVVLGLPEALRAAQGGFDKTGGMHAAALGTAEGTLLAVREDVGRHNAVDKVLGWAAREGRLPLSGLVLVVSARASFELVHKAYAAGVPALVAVSAPTSLAVELATGVGLTLVAFARPPRFSIYSGAHRIRTDDGEAAGGN